MIKRLAVIPARKNSKRIKNKNIYNFYGKPVISYALDTAKKSKLFDNIHVSTNCEKTINITKKLGFPIHFKRPNSLSDDKTGLIEVLYYVIENYKKLGLNYDVVTLIFPWSPLINTLDLKKANKVFEKNKKKNPVISISSFPVPLEWAMEKKGKFLKSVFPDKAIVRSQALSTKYFDTADFVFYSPEHIRKFAKSKKINFSQFIGYEIDNVRSVDVDEMSDVNLVKKLFLLSKKK